MPDPVNQDTLPEEAASQDTPTGTTLWNLQTQAPEYVQLADVQSHIDSGLYREYSGSTVPVAHGIGAPGLVPATQAAAALGGGARLVDNRAQVGAEARRAAQLREFDTAGDKALSFADGLVGGLSGGLVDGLPVGDSNLALEERRLRQEANPVSTELGGLAALAATVLAPESALKYTPLGAANVIFEGVRGAVGGTGVLATGLSSAAGGAVASATLAGVNSILNAVQGKPINVGAIVDDAGLGALVGGALGLAGGALGKAAGRIKNLSEEVSAASNLSETMTPVMGAIGDVAHGWDQAHVQSKARMTALGKLVDSGMLDADLPGEEWLQARTDALGAANKARTKLTKLAGVEDMPSLVGRLMDVAETGSPKEAERLFRAFDDWGTKVSALDDAMRPTSSDVSHLGNVVGDEAPNDVGDIGAHEHPMQVLENMINSGAPAADVEAFARAHNHYGGATQGLSHLDSALESLNPDIDSALAGLDTEASQVHKSASSEAVTGAKKVRKVTPVSEDEQIARGYSAAEPEVPENHGTADEYGAPPKRETINLREPTRSTRPVPDLALADEPVARGSGPARDSLPQVEIPGREGHEFTGSPGNYERPGEYPLEQPKKAVSSREEAGFQAKGVLGMAGRAQMPVRPSDLGATVQSALDRIQATAGTRLDTATARELATKLGMNLHAIQGPVASKLADIWALRQMSDALGKVGGKASKAGLLQQVLKNGVVSSAGYAGWNMAGNFGAGAARTLASHAVGAALSGVSGLAAIAGRAKNAVITGMSRVLTPTGRRALTMGAINHVVRESYAPGEPPTADFKTKATQLRQAVGAPDVIKKNIANGLQDLKGLDPVAYQGAQDMAWTRLQNLANRLPAGVSIRALNKTMEPSAAAQEEFQTYEQVTANKSVVFDYIRQGMMPDVVREALMEQHPEFLQELRTYVMDHPDDVQKAPYKSQKALGKLLGVNLVPESDPQYVLRQQASYQEAKQKQQATQGAQALKSGTMTLGQVLSQPRTN